MRRIITVCLGLLAAALLVLFSDWVQTDIAWAAGPIRVGAVFSMSAKSGFAGPLVGAPMKGVVTTVVAEVNRKGGILGRQIELFLEDDQSSPTEAAVVTTKLIRDRKVAVIIGPSLTGSAMSMMPVCEEG
jgi:branched-chain amino acid transport system substrate-binding protein